MLTTNRKTMAVIDLGSNSFHLAVVEMLDGTLRWQEACSEKIRLAAGLDETLQLDRRVMQRGLSCLTRFADRVAGIRREHLRVVATNTLRVAQNADEFLQRAETILGCSIDVVSGREEARFINLGVARSLPDNQSQRLVVDIGGGSTELILGQGYTANRCESLFMGSVGLSHQYFSDSQLTDTNYQAVVEYAKQLLVPIESSFGSDARQVVYGSSGTIRAVARACGNGKLVPVNLELLASLRHRLLKANKLDDLSIKGVPPARCRLLPAGLAILQAVMESLQIDWLEYVEGALREGVIHELAQEAQTPRPAENSLAVFAERYRVDRCQADRVAATARALAREMQPVGLSAERLDQLLQAASVHEVGLAVAHNQYHKHGAYLLKHSHLPGMSAEVLQQLSLLVRGQQHAVPAALLKEADDERLTVVMILRLAVCLHHARQDEDFSHLVLQRHDYRHWALLLPQCWQTSRPLLMADLQAEAGWLKKEDIEIKLSFELGNV